MFFVIFMRILLTGKSGQVGSELNKILTQFGEVIATGRKEMNLADPSQIQRVVQQIKPELIINAGAYTAVDKAESDQELAKAVKDRKSTRLNSSHIPLSRMPSSA